MKLTVVAATGGTGRHILDQAVAAGHDVTAVVRSPRKLGGAPVRVVAVDLARPDAGALREAVAGADAVLSALGATSATDAGVAERGTRAIVAAMANTGARRLVVLSAAPIGTVPSPQRPNPPRHDPGDGFFMRHLGAPFARTKFREHYADLARMEDVVRASDLDWTISRPPMFTGKPLTGSYREEFDRNIRGGFSIPRADVAHHMLALLERPETIGHVIGVAS
ncbi:NAD(P)-dependent oxidoreductase [Dactylosporangium sp. NPDC048998]|uniref:NAD(P)-dependent oxidoreductase n=1 Tax=Dactylosporangium sp. NPDC048998 TaxID=3363976 RepID=UPI00371FCEB3